MATWKTQIERYTDTVNIDELTDFNVIIAEAVNSCIEKANNDLLYKYAGEPEEITSAGVDVKGKKVLIVMRRTDDRFTVDSNTGDFEHIYVACIEKRFAEKAVFGNPKSRFYATPYSPIYYIENFGNSITPDDQSSGTLKIYPEPEVAENDDVGGKLYAWTYLEEVQADTEPNLLTTFPPQMVQWAVIIAAEAVLAYKLSQLIHAEEDAELSALVQNQLGLIRQMIQEMEPKFMEINQQKRNLAGGAE